MTGKKHQRLFDPNKYISLVADWLKNGKWPLEPPEPPEICVQATEDDRIVGWEINHNPLMLREELHFNIKAVEVGKAENENGFIKNHSYGILPSSCSLMWFRCDKDHRHGSHVHPGCESKRYYYPQDTLLHIECINFLAFIRILQHYINEPCAYPVSCKEESEYNGRISDIWRRIT